MRLNFTPYILIYLLVFHRPLFLKASPLSQPFTTKGMPAIPPLHLQQPSSDPLRRVDPRLRASVRLNFGFINPSHDQSSLVFLRLSLCLPIVPHVCLNPSQPEGWGYTSPAPVRQEIRRKHPQLSIFLGTPPNARSFAMNSKPYSRPHLSNLQCQKTMFSKLHLLFPSPRSFKKTSRWNLKIRLSKPRCIVIVLLLNVSTPPVALPLFVQTGKR